MMGYYTMSALQNVPQQHASVDRAAVDRAALEALDKVIRPRVERLTDDGVVVVCARDLRDVLPGYGPAGRGRALKLYLDARRDEWDVDVHHRTGRATAARYWISKKA